jgi:sugar phosphate permease
VTSMRRNPRQPYVVAVWLALGYVGIYLCRENLSVANPLLQQAFHASKERIGWIRSAANVAYMFGKFASGPVVDRLGGRGGFLAAIAGVAIFGGLGAFAPGLGALALFYNLNRFSGAGGWNAIIKVIATWFPPKRLATAIAVLSLSYVFGSITAKLFARQILLHGGGWRAVMGLPSLVLVAVLACCAIFVRPGPIREIPAEANARPPEKPANGDLPSQAQPDASAGAARPPLGASVVRLLRQPSFQTVCILSFVLTLLRDAFSTWSVDYLASLQTGKQSVATAALQSTAFDLAGAIPILAMGLLFDRLPPAGRRWLVVAILAFLAGVLMLLATVGKGHAPLAALLIGLVGLLMYGPYSVLGGVVAIECGGTERAGTATGIIDGTGYLAAVLAGGPLGRILGHMGYSFAFQLMAALTLLAALAALRLRAQPPLTVAAG